MAVALEACDETVGVDAVDRRLARGVDVRDGDDVGVVEAGGEILEQITQARDSGAAARWR